MSMQPISCTLCSNLDWVEGLFGDPRRVNTHHLSTICHCKCVIFGMSLKKKMTIDGLVAKLKPEIVALFMVFHLSFLVLQLLRTRPGKA